MFELPESWRGVLGDELEKSYCRELFSYIKKEYETETVYPPSDEVFAAFEHTPVDKIKAVIIGQDPYHGAGQAEGLCFSVKKDVAIPPSLKNIYIELSQDIRCDMPEHGSLIKWADQGVLLLNTILTVRENRPMSHKNIGWEKFTDAVLDAVDKQNRPIVYILWGKPAEKKAKKVSNPKHLVITGPHPSPLSAYRGFFGGKYFSRANQFFIDNDIEPIDWAIV